jgi:glycosyltransferase involved in cell wall biosynthesis
MKIFYQYSTLKTLSPTSGDQINEIGLLMALSRFAKVYFAGQLFHPDRPDFGLKNYVGDIRIKPGCDWYIIRANERVFRKCKGKRVWMSSPFVKDCFVEADKIGTFTGAWAEGLRRGENMGTLNPDQEKWPTAVPFYQTVLPQYKDMRGSVRTQEIRDQIGGTVIVGIFGRITKPSYPDLLLRSMPLLREKIPGIKVVLAITTNKVREIQPTDDVIITRFPYEDMPYALSACDVIAPANHEWGWQFSGAMRVIEPMTCNTPVLCQKSPARIEMLGKGYPYFMDDMADLSPENQQEYTELIYLAAFRIGLPGGYLTKKAAFYSVEQSAKRLEKILSL